MSICRSLNCDFIERLLQNQVGGLNNVERQSQSIIASLYNEQVEYKGKQQPIDYMDLIVQQEKNGKLSMYTQTPYTFKSKYGLNLESQKQLIERNLPKNCAIYSVSYNKKKIDYPGEITIVCKSTVLPLKDDTIYEYQIYNSLPQLKENMYDSYTNIVSFIENNNAFKI